MHYLKQNHLSLLIIAFLMLSRVFGGDTGVKPTTLFGGVNDITSITNSWVFNQDGQDIDYRVEGDTDTELIVTDASNDMVVTGNFTQGGGVVTVTPTSGSVTLTEANLIDGNVITFTASTTQAALTVTLPATSTMTTLLADAGDYREWVIENPFTAAATTTTIAAGTGIDLQEPDGQNVVIGINNYAFLTCFREASTDVVCRIDETIPAD